jgi:hypothetical protein
MIYAAIFFLNVLDLMLTHTAVNVLQVAEEFNPLMAPIVGSWLIVPVKLGAALFVVYGLHRCRAMKLGRAAAWFLLVVYILVVLNNSAVLFLETR